MFNLTLVTPEKKIVAGQEVDEVFVPGWRGQLNILPGHAPLLTLLRPGVLKYRLKGQSDVHVVAVSGGYCQVNPQGINVMAEAAERPEEIDAERSRAALKSTESLMLSEVMDDDTLKKREDKVARARARLELAK